jgi:hypothetical protein
MPCGKSSHGEVPCALPGIATLERFFWNGNLPPPAAYVKRRRGGAAGEGIRRTFWRSICERARQIALVEEHLLPIRQSAQLQCLILAVPRDRR